MGRFRVLRWGLRCDGFASGQLGAMHVVVLRLRYVGPIGSSVVGFGDSISVCCTKYL